MSSPNLGNEDTATTRHNASRLNVAAGPQHRGSGQLFTKVRRSTEEKDG